MEITLYEQHLTHGTTPFALYSFDEPSPNGGSAEEHPFSGLALVPNTLARPIQIRLPDGARVERPARMRPQLVWKFNGQDWSSDANEVVALARIKLHGFSLVPTNSQQGYQNSPGPIV
jgi:hypothetical protein